MGLGQNMLQESFSWAAIFCWFFNFLKTSQKNNRSQVLWVAFPEFYNFFWSFLRILRHWPLLVKCAFSAAESIWQDDQPNQFARKVSSQYNNSWLKLPYSILNFLKIKCIFIVRKIGQFLLSAHGGGGGEEGPSSFHLSNFRAKTLDSIFKIFSLTDALRMYLQT